MDTPAPTTAQQIAQAAIALQQERSGRSPEAATVVLTENALLVTLHGALSPAEELLTQSADGAARVKETYQDLLNDSGEPLRKEIERITGEEVSEAAAEIEPSTGAAVQVFASGTVVQKFRLAESVPPDTWSGISPVGTS
jgi:uncharacterized protein YbcI